MNHQPTINTIIALASQGVGHSHAERIAILFMETQEEPVTMSTLAAGAGLSRAAITALADRLEAANLIKRTSSTTDRRSIELVLTAKARRSVATAEKVSQVLA